MAIVNGKSTYAKTERPNKEGENIVPLNTNVSPTQTESLDSTVTGKEKLKRGVTANRGKAPMFGTSFDPGLRGGGGLAGPAGSPTNPMEAQTLKQSAEMINKKARDGSNINVPFTGGDIAKVDEPVVPTPDLNYNDRTTSINDAADAEIAKIKLEPARLTQQKDIDLVEAQRNKDLKDLQTEQNLVGDNFKDDLLKERIAGARELARTEGVSLNTAVQMYDKRQTARATLDPEKQRTYDAIVSQITAEGFDQNNAFNVAIQGYEKDGVDIDDMENAHKAIASIYGKNAADIMEDNFLKDVRNVDAAIVDGNRKLINARTVGETVKAGQGGARVTNDYLQTIDNIDSSLVPTAISDILSSPTATDDAKKQAGAFARDFYSDVETGLEDKTTEKSQEQLYLSGKLSPQEEASFLERKGQLTTAGKTAAVGDFLTEAEFKAGGGTAEDRAKFRAGTLELEQLKLGLDASGGILDPKTIANNIMSGVGDLNDVLTKNRQPVLEELKKLQTEAMDNGDLRGTLTASAIHGDKNPSDSFLSSFSKGRSVISQLGELKKLMFQDGYTNQETGEEIDLKPLSGWLAEKNPWDTDAQKIKAILQQTIPNLARGVFGEVGVLTDRDVELYRKTLPNLKSTSAVQQAVLGITLKAVQKSLENQIETQALGGRNMSRFVTAYDDIVAKTDELMGLRDLPQGIEETFKNATPKQQEAMIDTAKNSFFKVQSLRTLKAQSTEERQNQNDQKKNEIIDTKIESANPGQTIKATPEVAQKITSVKDELEVAGVKLQIADSFRTTETQKESYTSGKVGVAPPGTSFHEKGQAIDLAQVDEMKNEKVYAALRAQGFQQHPKEWWHWSIGEFNQNV